MCGRTLMLSSNRWTSWERSHIKASLQVVHTSAWGQQIRLHSRYTHCPFRVCPLHSPQTGISSPLVECCQGALFEQLKLSKTPLGYYFLQEALPDSLPNSAHCSSFALPKHPRLLLLRLKQSHFPWFFHGTERPLGATSCLFFQQRPRQYSHRRQSQVCPILLSPAHQLSLVVSGV